MGILWLIVYGIVELLFVLLTCLMCPSLFRAVPSGPLYSAINCVDHTGFDWKRCPLWLRGLGTVVIIVPRYMARMKGV